MNYLSVSSQVVSLATCNLNQWALDFDGNLKRVEDSIRIAKAKGSKYRLGPELELCGYGCEDHFLELDTFMHSEQSLASLLQSDLTDDILCDIGMPILHNNVRYNCRVFCLNRKIILIRPKTVLADDGNYRECRYFTSWKKRTLENHYLSAVLRNITGQVFVPMGCAVLQTSETKLGSEICEELWAMDSPNINYALSGVEIISNASGSHHTLRKLNTRISLMQATTSKGGGIYLYANQKGCDGGRLYFDGSALICSNGEILAQAAQFGLDDVEVVSAQIDLNAIRTYRQATASFQTQSSAAEPWPSIDISHFSLCSDDSTSITATMRAKYHTPEEECLLGPACWLWDYLRRSGASGYLLPLSGGADSAAVSAIVHCMCSLVADAIKQGNSVVMSDVERLFGIDAVPSPSELCNRVLHTVYMSSEHSSSATKNRSLTLSQQLSSYHISFAIDSITTAIIAVFQTFSNQPAPRFVSAGGSIAEDLALQNIQARCRMIMAYLCAQLLPWLRGEKGFLLVLGSSNVDEALRGYLTKYDCSSADVNPIGGISKSDLKRMLIYASEKYDISALKDIATAVPTAELRPIDGDDKSNYTQADEVEMGMTYEELSVFGILRKVQRCGPVSMFQHLRSTWSHLSVDSIAEKVKRFFKFYSINRHKQTTLTPSYHAENYSPDDNRFDLRPFLYNTLWSRQFNTIDHLLQEHNMRKKAAEKKIE